MSDAEQNQESFPSIERIELLELIGKGGMSSVYKARQTELDRIVAVKILSGISVDSEKSLQRFHNEAKLASGLNHPNIVKALGFGVSKSGLPYLLLEYIEGVTLSQKLSQEGRLNLQEFREVFIPALSALAFAHQNGFIHRDLKPGNIMLSKTGTEPIHTSLLDFGIAKFYGEQSTQQQLTRTGEIIGTPQYMSPEQCQSKELDQRSDIYSICCVMFEALTNEKLFNGNSVLEIMTKHCNEAPPTPSRLRNEFGFSEPLAMTILSGLAKKPEARPDTAEQLAKELDRVLGNSTQTLNSADKSHKTLLLVASASVISLLLLFSLYYKNSTKTEFPIAARKLSTNYKDISEGKKLVQSGKIEEALKFYDLAIPELKQMSHIRADKLADAYLQAALCIRCLQRPVASPLVPKELLSNWKDEANYFLRSSRTLAETLHGHDDNNLEHLKQDLVLKYCEEKSYQYEGMHVDELTEIIEDIDRNCYLLKVESFARKSEILRKILGIGTINKQVAFTIRNQLKSAESFGKKTTKGPGSSIQMNVARALSAMLEARMGNLESANSIVDDLSKSVLSENFRMEQQPKFRATFISTWILPVLLVSKNAEIAKQTVNSFMQQESNNSTLAIEKGELLFQMGEICKAKGQVNDAILALNHSSKELHGSPDKDQYLEKVWKDLILLYKKKKKLSEADRAYLAHIEEELVELKKRQHAK